ncbi:immunity protein [Bacillus sonorensis]|uniref:immunity protein n=1 Tax=Bacillus sonorensis TaxID=119858 RepID=UPI002DBC4E4C|nr:immunity protein [Bacillus sonorensis]MEC1437225.1 immunity protein [Bacillus sonorensis]
MFIAFLIIAGFIVFFGYALSEGKKQEEKRKEIKKNDRKNLDQYDLDFSPNKSYINPDGKMKIAFNSEKELFKIYRISPNGMIHDIAIPFNKIVDSEILIDDTTIMKASRGQQVAGALIGGAIAGGVGAIIGGSSPNTTGINNVKRIRLKITNEDFENPVYYIDFLPTRDKLNRRIDKGWNKEDSTVSYALKKAEYWQGVLELAIRKTNQVAH